MAMQDTNSNDVFSFLYGLQINWPTAVFTCIMNAFIFPKIAAFLYRVLSFLHASSFTCEKLFIATACEWSTQ